MSPQDPAATAARPDTPESTRSVETIDSIDSIVTAERMARFAERRRRFMQMMGSGLAILKSAPVTVRNRDVEHDYRQDSDLYYLTGFEEPGALAVFRPGHPEHELVLFVNPRDREQEIWTGRRHGPDGAKAQFGPDAAFSVEAIDEELPKLFDGADKLYYSIGHDDEMDRRILKMMRHHRTAPRAGIDGPDVLVEPAAILDELRIRKTAEEVSSLRRAADITAAAHREAMRAARPGLWEYQIQALIELVFRGHGSPRHGYAPIVAGGDNATVLHYATNRMVLRDGDLLLIDAGCELDYVTADVTRTFPVNGAFSGPQRAVYEVVLEAQKQAIDVARVGRSFQEGHDVAVRVLVEGMLELGLLSGDRDTIIAEETYKRFYMHRTGHWLGMDVHDAGRYRFGKAWRELEANMVVTVEPGLYIALDDTTVDERFRGIGVRIEDDVLVTEDGPVVLTALCPKEVDDVEAMCREESRFADLIPSIPG